MAEIKTGVRGLLAHPMVYDSFQYMVGAYAWRNRVVREFILPILRPTSKLLDIGCGTGEILKFLPDSVDYHGFDYNEAYIAQAKKRFAHRNAAFECRSVGTETAGQDVRYDIVLAFGLVHHLDDHEVESLVGDIKNLLKPTGKLFLLDPVFCENQSSWSRFIVSTDRGRNVRTSEQYLKLYRPTFTQVEAFVDNSPLRIPYSGITVACSISA